MAKNDNIIIKIQNNNNQQPAYFVKAGVDGVDDQRTVVAAHCDNSLCVHLVEFFRLGPVQTGIALLVDQQVGEVHLCECFIERKRKSQMMRL